MTKRRAPIQSLAAGELVLDAGTSRYLSRVLRLDPGESIVLFDPTATREADAKIVRIDGNVVVVHVGELRDAGVVPPRRITLVQGLAKGDKCDAIVRDATELGASEIVFVSTERSVVRLTGARAAERMTRWRKIANEAARQSARGDAPTLAVSSWTDAIDSIDPNAARFVLDVRAQSHLAPLLRETAEGDSAVAFAIGPEGGLTPKEVDQAEKQGWRAVAFGRTVLRTETMTAALLGAFRVLDEQPEAPG